MSHRTLLRQFNDWHVYGVRKGMCLIPCRVKPDYKTHSLTIFFFSYHIVLFGIPLIYIFFRFNLCRNIGFGVHNAITRVGAMVAPQLVFAVSIQLYLHTYLLPDLFLYSYEAETSYRGFTRKTKRSQPHPLISRSAIQMMSFH